MGAQDVKQIFNSGIWILAAPKGWEFCTVNPPGFIVLFLFPHPLSVYRLADVLALKHCTVNCLWLRCCCHYDVHPPLPSELEVHMSSPVKRALSFQHGGRPTVPVDSPGGRPLVIS